MLNLALPRLYAIVDASCFTSDAALFDYVRCLLSSGVTLLQYRNKVGLGRDMLSHAREIRRLTIARAQQRATSPAALIMNDRADLALAAGFDGVHVGQDDLSVEAVRAVVGPKMMVGVSTHNPEQVRDAEQCAADRLAVSYIAVGPVFATASKANPDPVIGLEGVRRARQLTSRPLVAIGGITRANAASVIHAGADSVAVISDLLSSPEAACEEFLKLLG
jgi:thiamine-phosphate pyrophosphorylase